MDQREADALVAVLQPLLKAYETLFFVARHLHPPRFTQLMGQIGTPDEDLRAARAAAEDGLSSLGEIGELINASSDAALQAFAPLREGADGAGDIRNLYRAFRYVPIGLEALYPLAGVLPPVGKFFLNPPERANEALLTSLAQPTHDKVGVMQFGAEGDSERGGFWLYVPENYSPDRSWPLVMALHGGSGTGRQFLWSWLRDARSLGAILVAPTAIGNTWAISGEDHDTPNLRRILEFVQSEWNVDARRLLLTGMSDGGTFTYVSGLDEVSPCLPIHITHGALDWMFPATMARKAQAVLSDAGAKVVYREIADLSHTYPREINTEMVAWLIGSRDAFKA